MRWVLASGEPAVQLFKTCCQCCIIVSLLSACPRGCCSQLLRN
jgi:hypothetical protein